MAKRKNKTTLDDRAQSLFFFFLVFRYIFITLWVAELAIIGFLDEISAIDTEDITSVSKKLTDLLSKINDSTGKAMTSIFYFILFYFRNQWPKNVTY